MNIIVCVKQIPDPEIPASKFRLDAEGKKVVPPEGIPPVINPYDEQAVELALKLKDKHGGKITILTIGDDSSIKAIKHAVAMGADEGILCKDKAFEDSDSFSIAYVLSQAIQKIKDFDLILCGRQAADWDEGLVGSIIAENLDLPLVTLAESVEVVNETLKVKRVILDGFQVFAVPRPAVMTVSHELGQPRLPSGWGIINASKKKIPVWSAKDIGVDLSRVRASAFSRELVRLFIPARERECEFVEGKTAEEAAVRLAERLREAGTI